MIKSKIYFIVPIIAIAIFFGYYWNFSSGYEQHQAEVAAAEKQKRLDKLAAENEARKKAIEDANAAQVVRKAERAEREAKERKQKDDEENAKLARDKADQEQQKLSRQVEKLTKDVKEAKDELMKLETEKTSSTEEVAFLKTYVAQAQENVAKLDDVVKKIELADAAAAKAAALKAAEDAKKSS